MTRGRIGQLVLVAVILGTTAWAQCTDATIVSFFKSYDAAFSAMPGAPAARPRCSAQPPSLRCAFVSKTAWWWPEVLPGTDNAVTGSSQRWLNGRPPNVANMLPPAHEFGWDNCRNSA